MKRLVIVRHAKAEKDAPRHADFERTLADRGRSDAAEMGRRLARRGMHPDAVIASAARRTLETAKAIARELDFPWGAIVPSRKAYLADSETLLEIVQECPDEARILFLVGHNPGVSELARKLARRFAEELPTGAAVAIDCAADTWGGVRPGCGSLRWYETPRPRG